MTQPDYVPLEHGTRVRAFDELKVPGPWLAKRVSEVKAFKGSPVEQGKHLGIPGPGSGFALKLTKVSLEGVQIDASEHYGDVERVISSVAMKRAAFFSRAPVIFDVKFALKLFGYSKSQESQESQELVKFRSEIISGCAHDYFKVRRLLEMIPITTLGLSPDEIRISTWREYFILYEA